MRRTILPLSLVVLLYASLSTPAAQPKSDPTKLPPEHVTKAWAEAGATLGWLRDDGNGVQAFTPEGEEVTSGFFTFRPDPERKSEDVPAYAFLRKMPEAGVIAKLPDPKLPFGLVLGKSTTDALLKEVAGQGSLRVLKVQLASELTDDGLKPLAALQDLEKLELQYTAVKGTGLEHLNGLKKLRSVAISSMSVTDDGVAAVAKLAHLRVLSLWECLNVTDAGVVALAGLKDLQALDLRWTKLTDTGLGKLAGVKALRRLSLSKTKVTDAGLKAVAGMKEMQILNLEQTGVTDAGLEHLAAMSKLRELHMPGTKVSGTGLTHMAKARELWLIDLCQTPVTEEGVKVLGGMKGLRGLALMGTDMTDDLLKPLTGLTDLEVLMLRKTKVTDVGLEHLGGMKSLQHITLGQTKVTEAGVEKLQKALPKCRLTE